MVVMDMPRDRPGGLEPTSVGGSRGGGSDLRLGPYLFKPAETDAEFDQVHRLNYEMFVREVAQYDDPGTGRLVDKFHHKNLYLIAKRGGDLVGMVAAHDRPPFSVADRLADPGVIDRPGGRPLEVRLLGVRPDCRGGPVFSGLLWTLHEYARRQGHTRVLISGLDERVPLYEKLGFRALGPAVACGGAAFVPMALDLGRPPGSLRRTIARWRAHLGRETRPAGRGPISLLPGPVEVSARVRSAWSEAPVSHRGDEFVARFERVRDRLAGLVGGESGVALLVGGGTLANDVIAATLAADRAAGAGLILVNGEFGARLVGQAARVGLRFRTLRQRPGRSWDLGAVAGALGSGPAVGWVWGVHLESSTGVLNDLPGLLRVVDRAGARLCVDAVSSLGAVPLNLRGVHLASGGSGKALGAFAGLAIVFAGPDACASPGSRRVPTTLDLAAALAARGPRFTIASPLLAALDRALDDHADAGASAARHARHDELGRIVRAGLQSLGLWPIADQASASPVVTTFAPPPGRSAVEFAAACRSLGYEVAHASDHLRRRGWVQIATMGEIRPEDLPPLFAGLARWLGRPADPPATASGRPGVGSGRIARDAGPGQS
jgi:aspartate aminotransferase-like enzyme/predicted N-acetyltransferase YhbS